MIWLMAEEGSLGGSFCYNSTNWGKGIGVSLWSSCFWFFPFEQESIEHLDSEIEDAPIVDNKDMYEGSMGTQLR